MAIRLSGSLRNLRFRLGIPPAEAGSIMFVPSFGTPSTVNQYSLGIPWDSSTASFVDSVGTTTAGALDLYISPDGLRMFTTHLVTGSISVDSYDLSVAWDVTTASFVNSFSQTPTGVANGIFFRPDGTKMFISATDALVRGYDLSVAWNITTASFVDSFSVTNPSGVYFRSDGQRAFVSDGFGSVNRFDITTPWDLTTASSVNSFNTGLSDNIAGLHFRTDGLKMGVAANGSAQVSTYDLSVAWDITTATSADSFNVSAQAPSPTGLFFNI